MKTIKIDLNKRHLSYGKHSLKVMAVQRTEDSNLVDWTKYIGVVSTPVISKDSVHNVTISCDTNGATIYYTIDGSTPSKSSTLYTGAFFPETSTDRCTIKAIAYKTNFVDSEIETYIWYKVFIGSDGNEYYYSGSYNNPVLYGATINNGDNVTIPDVFNFIPYGVFTNNTKIKNLYIPNTIDTIEYNAFQECSSLEYLEFLPVESSLRPPISIGKNAFNGCSSLRTINFSAFGGNFKKCTFGDNTYSSGVWDGCNLRHLIVTQDNFGTELYSTSNIAYTGVTRTSLYYLQARFPGKWYMNGYMYNGSGDKKEYYAYMFNYNGSGGLSKYGEITHVRSGYSPKSHSNAYVMGASQGSASLSNTTYNDTHSTDSGGYFCWEYSTGDYSSNKDISGKGTKVSFVESCHIYGLGSLTESEFATYVQLYNYAFTGLNNTPSNDPVYFMGRVSGTRGSSSANYYDYWSNWKGRGSQTKWTNMNSFCYPTYIDQWIPVKGD